LESNQESSLLLKEYNKKVKQLQKAERSENADSYLLKQITIEVQKLKNKMNSDICIREFFSAQKEFNNLMRQINDIISFYLTGEISGNSGCSSGNCGSCCGCGNKRTDENAC